VGNTKKPKGGDCLGIGNWDANSFVQIEKVVAFYFGKAKYGRCVGCKATQLA